MSEFTATTGSLVAQIRTAREAGDEQAAARALEELLSLYVQLGNRQIGTAQEQNAYVFPRHLGLLPQELTDLGVQPSDLPEPPGRRRPADPLPQRATYIGTRVANPRRRND